ncbi:MAG: hypothetical protein KDK91_11980 [Gammaproteobacteria bacterium]|nr:hypothetical protein [Gammaproteobacteria bacterium]
MTTIRNGMLGLVVLVLSGCAVAPEREMLRGPALVLPDLANADDVASASSEQKVLMAFASRAGLSRLPDKDSEDWWLIVGAGLNVVDEQCERYMGAIFWADRKLRTANAQVSLLGASTAAVMGLASVSAKAIATTAAAFGLVNQGIENYSKGLLYQIEPSAIRQLVERSQSAYRQALNERHQGANDPYVTRSAAVSAIQGYLSLCLPVSIETQVNRAVSTTDFVADRDKDPDALGPRPALRQIPSLEERSAMTERARAEALAQTRASLENLATQAITSSAARRQDDRPLRCIGAECAMRLEQAKSVQRALCVTADGDFGSKTRQAIRRFEASDSSSTPELVSNRNGELDVTEWTQLIGVGNCTAPFQNALERFRYSFKSSGFSQPDSGLVGALVTTLERRAASSFSTPKPITFDATLRAALARAHEHFGIDTMDKQQVTIELLDCLKATPGPMCPDQ